MLQHNSFGVPDYVKFSDDGSAREQALADHGDRMRYLPCTSPAAPPCMHACRSLRLGTAALPDARYGSKSSAVKCETSWCCSARPGKSMDVNSACTVCPTTCSASLIYKGQPARIPR